MLVAASLPDSFVLQVIVLTPEPTCAPCSLHQPNNQHTPQQGQADDKKQQKRSPPDPQQLQALWQTFVEGSCLSSSHERKALALQLLQLLLPVMGPDMVPVLLSKQVLSCVATALKDKESYLHASAKRCLVSWLFISLLSQRHLAASHIASVCDPPNTHSSSFKHPQLHYTPNTNNHSSLTTTTGPPEHSRRPQRGRQG